jgi:seryl-tRNA synthetase
MAITTPSVEQADALADLEERVLRAVQLVNQLRQEKDAIEKEAGSAIAEKDAAVSSAAELKAENARMAEELEMLRSERKQVRARIEKLLGQMDLLAG